MSSNYIFTYTKTDIAFITSELCKLHKRDASYLCIFADVIYMNMRIEIPVLYAFVRAPLDVIYMNMRIEIAHTRYLIKNNFDVIYMNMRIENLRKRNGRSFGERDRLIMSHNERKNYEIRSK